MGEAASAGAGRVAFLSDSSLFFPPFSERRPPGIVFPASTGAETVLPLRESHEVSPEEEGGGEIEAFLPRRGKKEKKST